jgi:hypothetical protein
MKTWGIGGIAPPFFTSALGGDEWSVSSPRPLSPIGRAPIPTGQEAWRAPGQV